MTWDLEKFNRIVDAEEYFIFFNLPYSPQIVNVNRLHILKKFSQYMKEIDLALPDLGKQDRLSQYRIALKRAYDVFLTSNALEQKLFKVFNEKRQNVVLLTEINS